MSLIRPFAGLRPVPERAEEVIAPPYDVLNSAEAREQVKGVRGASFISPKLKLTYWKVSTPMTRKYMKNQQKT